MFHQFHCLDALRHAVLAAHDPVAAQASSDGGHAAKHTHHCLNYLRQTILCAADVTLEPFVNPGIGLGVVHQCRDWTQVYEWAEANWVEYQAWRDDRIEQIAQSNNLL